LEPPARLVGAEHLPELGQDALLQTLLTAHLPLR
jgi:hypothetical protein